MNEEQPNPTNPSRTESSEDIKLSPNHKGNKGLSDKECVSHEDYIAKNNSTSTCSTCSTYDRDDIYDNKLPAFFLRFEPPCVKKAREIPSLKALKVIIAWAKRRGLTESQRLRLAQTFLKYHKLPLSLDVLEALNVPTFSCELARNLELCDESACSERLTPAEQLILHTESVLLFHSTGELDIKIAGTRKVVPLRKLFSRNRERQYVNTTLFDQIYLDCYYFPPNPPFNEEDALKVYQYWLDCAQIVKDPTDPDTAIERAVIEILTTRREFYRIDLLKDGTVPPAIGFFVDDRGVVYIESSLLRELLNDLGIRDRPEKIARACRRILAGSVLFIRFGKENRDRRYFWRFNLRAVQAILQRDGVKWSPEVHETFEMKEIAERIGFSFKNEDDREDDHDSEPESSSESANEEIIDVWMEIQGFIESLVQKLLSKRLQPQIANSIARLLTIQLKTIEIGEIEARL